jgi:hypothetical protein
VLMTSVELLSGVSMERLTFLRDGC